MTPNNNKEKGGGKKDIDKEAGKELRKNILSELNEDQKNILSNLEDVRKSKILPLFLRKESINFDLVNNVYDLLEKNYKNVKNLDVIVDSSGGDIHSAYHLAKILRRYALEKLTFIVPRWAKSAATLLIFGGDEIILGPTSELGPLDPQIIEIQKGIPHTRFSPLAIKTALDLISENREIPELVKELSAKLPPTIQLGQHIKSLEIAERYVIKLLTTKMLKDVADADKIASKIGRDLTQNYPDHGYCIDIEEAIELGLVVKEANVNEWKMIWKLYELISKEEKDETIQSLRKILKSQGLNDRKIDEEINKIDTGIGLSKIKI